MTKLEEFCKHLDNRGCVGKLRVANLLDEMAAKGEKVIPAKVRNAGKFLLKIDEELALIGMRNGIGKERILKHLFSVKEYDQLLEKLAKQIKGENFQ